MSHLQNRPRRVEFFILMGMRRGVRARFGQGVSATKHHTNQAANMPLRDSLSNTWSHIQGFLFPMLRDAGRPTHRQALPSVLQNLAIAVDDPVGR